jgi:hypothetical protein
VFCIHGYCRQKKSRGECRLLYTDAAERLLTAFKDGDDGSLRVSLTAVYPSSRFAVCKQAQTVAATQDGHVVITTITA